VRAETRFPVFHAARIPDVATARHAVAEGRLDMVGMTRAHIAEPHIARKIMEGREHEIRPCVGATYCLDRIYTGGEALCIHNPATGREAGMPHEIAPGDGPARKVVVVGAGPAGLEAARVASARGHGVVLFEAAPEAGGQVRLTARSPRRREMIGIVDWRMERCADQGVDFRFSTMAEGDDVLSETPDDVVIATGGLPNTGVLAAGNDLVVSTWDILAGDVAPGRRVLLYDDAGGHAAMQTAEAVLEAGAALEIVTPERGIGVEIGNLNLAPHIRAMQRRGFRVTPFRRVAAVERAGNALRATLSSDYGPSTEEREADQVIVDHATLPLADLYFALRPLSSNAGAVDHAALLAGRPQEVVRNSEGRFRLFRIGDAVAARNTHAAIYDALRLLKDV
jgi:hypothetical protein